GQRKGLGISYKSPLYVIGIEPKKNIIIVGGLGEVMKKRFAVKDINWLREMDGDRFEAWVKIRYNHKKAKAFLKKVGRIIEVEFEKEQEAITPGQAAVFYSGEYVIGGGWIDRVLA
ncbi:MAG: tRNA 2-thiouridine(34) synthase MnmA, partial [Candidatus Omnitrophica bacterium]|nr:tRNA 2-thiouridine(34) synthase MnmA [Candidatus Omnitrophota bacterium]